MRQLVSACFAVLFFLFSCGRPLLPVDNTGMDNVGQIMRVLSYNIHHANPPSKPGIIDIDAIAEVIKKEKPDLVALQEIDVHTARSGKQVHEAELLAAKTEMEFFFARAIDYDGGEYGIAILSKYPITDTQKFQLPTIAATKGEPRVLATAVIELPRKKKIRFACTHLDAQGSDTNRVLQIKKILDVLKPEKLPVVLAGDLNDVAGSTTINLLDQFLQRTCMTNCAFTIPELHPVKTIDFIAFTPGKFAVTEHAVIPEMYASDHRPVLSVLKFIK